jgi:hypothetical protein
MDDFDSRLDWELRLLLDPVVASPAPVRRWLAEHEGSFITLAPIPVERAVTDRPVPPFR